MKNILIISTSLRPHSNSEILAKEFEKGALESGNNVEFINLTGKKINYCIGCLKCQKSQKCIIKDDTEEILEKIKNSDTIIFATPIYFYEMSGQMKTLLDRTNPLFTSDYSFKDIYLITTSADMSESASDGAVNGIKGWIECFEKARFAGLISGVGLTDANEANNNAKLLKKAYEAGKNV